MKQVLSSDDPEQCVGLVDDGEPVDVAVGVGQEREQFVDVGLRPDGHDVFGHHVADRSASVSREVDAQVELVPREIDGVGERFEEGRKADRDPERPIGGLKQIDEVPLSDDPDDEAVLGHGKAVEVGPGKSAEDLAHVVVRGDGLDVASHYFTGVHTASLCTVSHSLWALYRATNLLFRSARGHGMESLNRMAVELVDEAIDFADELAIEIHELDNGAVVCDFGVETVGGVEAGLLLTEIQTGGLATVQTGMETIGDAPLTHVEVSTDHPAMAFLAAQKAGWELSVEGFEGLGSGPARALVAEEEEYQRMGYRDAAEFAVLAIESEELPDEAVAEHVAETAGVPTSSVFLPTFSTASVTGSVALAARAAELATFRLSELGYDPIEMLSTTASAPVAPVAGSDDAAMARTNDALAYGGQVHMTVESSFDRFDDLPSTAGTAYGVPFAEIFEEHGWEFYDLPVEVFAPAQVTIDIVGEGVTVVGETDEALLAESFGLADQSD